MREDETQHKTGDRGLYVILDVLSAQFLGPISVFRSEAAALRFFSDVLRSPDTAVNKHPEDHVLLRLGILTDDHDIIPGRNAVMQGSKLAASFGPTSADSENANLRIAP